jgi:hypothetical protein
VYPVTQRTVIFAFADRERNRNDWNDQDRLELLVRRILSPLTLLHTEQNWNDITHASIIYTGTVLDYSSNSEHTTLKATQLLTITLTGIISQV